MCCVCVYWTGRWSISFTMPIRFISFVSRSCLLLFSFGAFAAVDVILVNIHSGWGWWSGYTSTWKHHHRSRSGHLQLHVWFELEQTHTHSSHTSYIYLYINAHSVLLMIIESESARRCSSLIGTINFQRTINWKLKPPIAKILHAVAVWCNMMFFICWNTSIAALRLIAIHLALKSLYICGREYTFYFQELKGGENYINIRRREQNSLLWIGKWNFRSCSFWFNPMIWETEVLSLDTLPVRAKSDTPLYNICS